MTDLDAILRAVVADPCDDTPRLVYAEICDDLAGVVACPACGGSGWTTREKAGGSYAAESPWLIPDFATVGCPRCGGARDRRGSGSVSNGLAELAEFVRAQVELARLVVRPLAEVMLHPNPASSQSFGPGLVAGTLGGSPEGVVAGAVVDWTASTGLDRADGYYTGVGVVESVGQDRHGLTVRLRPTPNQGSRPDRDAAREKRRALRVHARQLFDPHCDRWFTVPSGYGLGWHLTTDSWDDQRPGFLVARGFVDELRCDLRTFVGGECRGCDGRGGWGGLDGDDAATMCLDCTGTGRVGLDLAAVFAAHPIARVATDREPTAASHQSGAWHWTWVGNDADSRVGLPRKLMAALSASGIARVFDSRDAAMDALSLACVNLGRTAAGLDPLT